MELEYKKCVFCLGSTSNLNIHDIGLTKLIYHPTCIYRYKCALSLIYILIIILDLLVYTSLDLPDYFNTFIIFGISYIFTGILAYVVSANSTNILHYAIGAIPTVVNHVILLVTSLISKYNSSVISPKIVTYIFLGFSWSIVVCVILVGILWGFMFLWIVAIRNICKCIRYCKYGGYYSMGSLNDEILSTTSTIDNGTNIYHNTYDPNLSERRRLNPSQHNVDELFT